ncbi:hypothetical protein BN1013_01964 [Candidatus Rubidus massiliensis]|nr:hypothetical protein BN1013_01964 [Candidatus Rubidus massiliensis]
MSSEITFTMTLQTYYLLPTGNDIFPEAKEEDNITDKQNIVRKQKGQFYACLTALSTNQISSRNIFTTHQNQIKEQQLTFQSYESKCSDVCKPQRLHLPSPDETLESWLEDEITPMAIDHLAADETPSFFAKAMDKVKETVMSVDIFATNQSNHETVIQSLKEDLRESTLYKFPAEDDLRNCLAKNSIKNDSTVILTYIYEKAIKHVAKEFTDKELLGAGLHVKVSELIQPLQFSLPPEDIYKLHVHTVNTLKQCAKAKKDNE